MSRSSGTTSPILSDAGPGDSDASPITSSTAATLLSPGEPD